MAIFDHIPTRRRQLLTDSPRADYLNTPSWHADILIFIVSHAAATMTLGTLNLFEISHAAEHVSRPLTRDDWMADAISELILSDNAGIFFCFPYPKRPSWHLLIRTSSRSIAVPTSAGSVFRSTAMRWASAQDMVFSDSFSFILAAIISFNSAPCLFPA
jgi:hypothetical protein